METLLTIPLRNVNEDVILEVLENLPSPTVKLVDIGIGPYEFQGAPGNDSRMAPEYDTGEWRILINIFEPRAFIFCSEKMVSLLEFIDNITDDQRRYAESDDPDAEDASDQLKLLVDKHLTFYPNSTRPHSLSCVFSWEVEP